MLLVLLDINDVDYDEDDCVYVPHKTGVEKERKNHRLDDDSLSQLIVVRLLIVIYSNVDNKTREMLSSFHFVLVDFLSF